MSTDATAAIEADVLAQAAALKASIGGADGAQIDQFAQACVADLHANQFPHASECARAADRLAAKNGHAGAFASVIAQLDALVDGARASDSKTK